MRRLASELGMSPMITYYYIKSKNEMLDLVVERIWQRLPIPGPEIGDWKERLRTLTLRVREILIKYPGLAQVIQTRPHAPTAHTVLDFVDQMLLEAGMDEAMLSTVSFALYQYTFGAIAWEMQARATGKVNEVELAAQYANGLDVVLEGLAAAVAGNLWLRVGPRRSKRASVRGA